MKNNNNNKKLNRIGQKNKTSSQQKILNQTLNLPNQMLIGKTLERKSRAQQKVIERKKKKKNKEKDLIFNNQ